MNIPLSVRFAIQHPCQTIIRAFFGFVLITFATLLILQHNYQQAAETHSEREHAGKEDTDAALALYTLWLTGFTGILALSTIGLWLTTKSGMKDQGLDMKASISAAETSANAATQAAIAAENLWKSSVEADRPWMTIKELEYPFIEKDTVGPTIEKPFEHQVINGQGIKIWYENTGKRPGLAEFFVQYLIVPFSWNHIPTFTGIATLPIFTPKKVALVGVGRAGNTPMIKLDGEQRNDLVEQKTKIAVYTVVRYWASPKQSAPYYTETCGFVSYNGYQKSSIDGEKIDQFTFAPIGPQNNWF